MDKTVLYDLTYGLYAIGVKDKDRDCGCIVNTVFQISGEGPIIALSMNKDNYTFDLIKETQKFSVSILSEKTNPEVISRLGFVSGKDHDKWQNFAYDHFGGLPIVKENVLGHMICEVVSMSETSTHFVILAKVVNAQKDVKGVAMTYTYYHNVIKGKAPKKAPTYQEESIPSTTKDTWVCSVCGYVYDGDDFDAEPDTYECPICHVPKMMFEKK
ncbi:MAG: hypothetical protein EOM50_08155 [Erysipelotrichia bacterium]|nr:hypothetical protein [Erysipelotrichia bacterium]NCC54650.1 hypothetical protein [Erysipelotrichia bacterium]